MTTCPTFDLQKHLILFFVMKIMQRNARKINRSLLEHFLNNTKKNENLSENVNFVRIDGLFNTSI